MKDVTLSSVKYVAESLKFMGPYGAMNTLQISLPRFLLWCWFCIFFIIWIATSLLEKRRGSPSDHQAHIALIYIQKNPAALFFYMEVYVSELVFLSSNTTEDFSGEEHFTFLNFYGELLTPYCFSFFRSFFNLISDQGNHLSNEVSPWGLWYHWYLWSSAHWALVYFAVYWVWLRYS